jgi:hypothetical protein
MASEPLLHYRLPNPGISSISADGVEHKVNPETGLLEIHDITPSLMRVLEHHNGERLVGRALAEHVDRAAGAPQQPLESPEDRAEREDLLTKLDAATGRRTDRRRSIQQLRAAWREHEAK